MAPPITPLHAVGPALPMSLGRSLLVLGVGIVAFVAVCYLWYWDFRVQRGETS